MSHEVYIVSEKDRFGNFNILMVTGVKSDANMQVAGFLLTHNSEFKPGKKYDEIDCVEYHPRLADDWEYRATEYKCHFQNGLGHYVRIDEYEV